jgi:hypothetical protein
VLFIRSRVGESEAWQESRQRNTTVREVFNRQIRGFYPGVTYQLGNLLAAINLPLLTRLAEHYDQNFGLGMAIVIVPVLLLTALVTWLGPENREAEFGRVTVGEAARRPSRGMRPATE